MGRGRGAWLRVLRELYRSDRCARCFQAAFIFFRMSLGKRCSANIVTMNQGCDGTLWLITWRCTGVGRGVGGGGDLQI